MQITSFGTEFQMKSIFLMQNDFYLLGFASVGAARLLNIYPFNVTHKNLQLEKKQEGS
jgi:hypothetical protein